MSSPLFSIAWGKNGAVVFLDDRDISSTIERIEHRENPEGDQRVWLCLVNSKVMLSRELEGSVPLMFTREILDEVCGRQNSDAGVDPTEERDANARLMASAPELLEALKTVAAGLPSFPDPRTPDGLGVLSSSISLTVGQVRQCRAVIAKAEGK